MPRLPDKFDLGARPIPNVSRPIVSADVSAPFRAMSELGETVGKIAIKEGEKANDLDYMKAKAYFNSKNIPALDTYENDPDYSTYKTRYTEQASQFKDEALQVVRNPALREKLALELDNDITQNISRLDKLSTAKFRDYNRVQFDEASTQLRNAYNAAKTPEDREKIKRDQARLAISLAETGEDKSYVYKKMKDWESAANKTQVLIDATNDLDGVTKAVEARVKGGAGVLLTNTDDILNYIIDKHEGGYSATDGNTNVPVNFGINQKANPDIDVKNLTKEQAIEIYKERYVGDIEKLPENMRLIAADTLINFGTSGGQKLIDAANNDPVKLAQLRKEKHSELTKSNPKLYGGNVAKAWQRRDDDMMAAVSGGSNVTGQYSYVNGLDMDDSIELYAKLSKEKNKQENKVLRNKIRSTTDLLTRVSTGEASLKEIKQSPELTDEEKKISEAILLGDEPSLKAVEDIAKSTKLISDIDSIDSYSMTTELDRVIDEYAIAKDEDENKAIGEALNKINTLKTKASIARAINVKNRGKGLSKTDHQNLMKQLDNEAAALYESADSPSWISTDSPFMLIKSQIADLTTNPKFRAELLGAAYTIADRDNIDLYDKESDRDTRKKTANTIIEELKILRRKQLGIKSDKPATAVLVDGKKENLGAVPEGTKGDNKVSVNYKVMVDKNGVKAKVYNDGRIEVIK